MRSPIDSEKEKSVSAFLLTLGVSANIIELFIPSPPFLPWLKPGFANAFTMAAIYLLGPWKGIQIAILRSLISGTMSGAPFTSLIIGGTGGLLSASAMGLLWSLLGKNRVSLFGLGIFGAFIHTLTQLFIVYLLFVRNVFIFWQIPLLGPAAIVSGVLTGIIAAITINFINESEINCSKSLITFKETGIVLPIIKLSFLIALSILIFLLKSLLFQAIAACLVFIVLFFKKQKSIAIIFRFTPLLLITFLLNALTEPGRIVQIIPWFTYEGLNKGTFLVFRLVNLVGLSLVFVSQNDFIVLMTRAGSVFPVLSSFTEIGIRGINGIPVTVKALKEFYSNAEKKGVIYRVRYLYHNLPDVFHRILTEL